MIYQDPKVVMHQSDPKHTIETSLFILRILAHTPIELREPPDFPCVYYPIKLFV